MVRQLTDLLIGSKPLTNRGKSNSIMTTSNGKINGVSWISIATLNPVSRSQTVEGNQWTSGCSMFAVAGD